ncbi:MAG: CoA transferase [Deltaproteobacteria bacterium]|nr:CoA transferase [Deltaproteobacteria bacterium]
MSLRPLAGTRVLDVTRLLPGPYATRVLAELGAEVVKVEPPDGGDYARWWPPLVGDPPTSGAFRELNRGKRGVALDIRAGAGREVFRALVARADVLVDGFRPGVLARLGLDPRVLMAEHPRLVYCAITGFGLFGPDVDRAGHDVGYLARAGALGVTGPREAPMTMGIQVADVGASLVAVSGVLAALLERARSGKGTVVDVSLVEAGLPFNALNFGVVHSGERVVRGDQLLDGSKPCYTVYRTQDDRFLALGALEPKFWMAFCEAVGLPHLAPSGFDGGDSGVKVRAEVQARLLEKTQAEWVTHFRGTDCCIEPVREMHEVAEDPHLRARGVFDETPGLPPLVRAPIRVTSWEDLTTRAAETLSDAPALGRDTAAVCRDWGVDEALIAELG